MEVSEERCTDCSMASRCWAPVFSKSALPILHDTSSSEIEIKSGIDWRGDIFSTILSTYPKGIRVGDDLLVMQDGNLIGSARATAPYWEWMGSPGRLARSHHRLG